MSIHTDVKLPPAEAIKFVKSMRRGRRFFVMVHNHAPIADKPDHVFPTCASVPISHADALEYIEKAYGGFADRGALVPITYGDSLLWIG